MLIFLNKNYIYKIYIIQHLKKYNIKQKILITLWDYLYYIINYLIKDII